jgi:hypothetical protein
MDCIENKPQSLVNLLFSFDCLELLPAQPSPTRFWLVDGTLGVGIYHLSH